MKDHDGIDRCEVCGWPLAETAAGGCRPNDCSMRPRPGPTYAERVCTVCCALCPSEHVGALIAGETQPNARARIEGAATSVGWRRLARHWLCAGCVRDAIATAFTQPVTIALLQGVRAWVGEDVGRDLLPAERQLWDAWQALPEVVRVMGEPRC